MLHKFIQYFLDLFYPLFKKIFPYRLYAYLAVGAANTLLNIALFALFYQLLLPQSGINIFGFTLASYTLSLIIAFIITVPTGFWLAGNFAFKAVSESENKNKGKLFRYFLVVLQGLVSDYLILKGLIVFFDMYPTIAKIISTVIVLVLNFLLQKYYTFKVKNE